MRRNGEKMGSRTVNFGFTPGENEQIETVIKIPEERRSIIHGIVKSHCNMVIPDAVVKLFECINHHGEQILKPITHTFTDECGQFAFGPLWPCRNYVIKVWINDVKIRELVIHPDNCECQKEGRSFKDSVITYEVNQDIQNETNMNTMTAYCHNEDSANREDLDE